MTASLIMIKILKSKSMVVGKDYLTDEGNIGVGLLIN